MVMNRREAVAALLKDRGDLLVVTGLGSPTYDVAAVEDHPRNYYLWGAMGSAAMIGLGLAKSRPDDRVLVVTGDGELMMGLGALATIAVQAPKNLTIAVLDNGQFGETGAQISHSGHGTALEKVAESVGFGWTSRITDAAGIDAVRIRTHAGEGLGLAAISIATGEEKRVMPSRDGVYIKDRFRTALGTL